MGNESISTSIIAAGSGSAPTAASTAAAASRTNNNNSNNNRNNRIITMNNNTNTNTNSTVSDENSPLIPQFAANNRNITNQSPALYQSITDTDNNNTNIDITTITNESIDPIALFNRPIDPNPRITAIRFILFLLIFFSYVSSLFIFGLLSNSLALITEAIHTAGDAIIYSINIWIHYKSIQINTIEYPFGLMRLSVVGGLFSAIIIIVGAVIMSIQAITALINGPEVVDSLTVIIVSSCGLVANCIAMLLLPGSHTHSHSHESDSDSDTDTEADIEAETDTTILTNTDTNTSTTTTNPVTTAINSLLTRNKSHHTADLNLYGMMRNLLADSISSLLILSNAIFTYYSNYSWKYYMDPITSLIIALIIILVIARPLLLKCIYILLHRKPSNININTIINQLKSAIPELQLIDNNSQQNSIIKIYSFIPHQYIAHCYLTIQFNNINNNTNINTIEQLKSYINLTRLKIKSILKQTAGIQYSTVEIVLI